MYLSLLDLLSHLVLKHKVSIHTQITEINLQTDALAKSDAPSPNQNCTTYWLFAENPLIVPPKGKPSWYRDLTCKNIKARLKRAKRYRKMHVETQESLRKMPEEDIWYMTLDAVEIYWECQFRDNKSRRKIFQLPFLFLPAQIKQY